MIRQFPICRSKTTPPVARLQLEQKEAALVALSEKVVSEVRAAGGIQIESRGVDLLNPTDGYLLEEVLKCPEQVRGLPVSCVGEQSRTLPDSADHARLRVIQDLREKSCRAAKSVLHHHLRVGGLRKPKPASGLC